MNLGLEVLEAKIYSSNEGLFSTIGNGISTFIGVIVKFFNWLKQKIKELGQKIFGKPYKIIPDDATVSVRNFYYLNTNS